MRNGIIVAADDDVPRGCRDKPDLGVVWTQGGSDADEHKRLVAMAAGDAVITVSCRGDCEPDVRLWR
jgi:hypothetical protein